MNTYPDPTHEAPHLISPELLSDLTLALNEKYASELRTDEYIKIHAQTGAKAAWLKAQIGTKKSAHVFEFFVRHPETSDLEGGLGLLIDYLDGVLAEFFEEKRETFFPLDFTPRTFENICVWSRHDMRNFDCEIAADRLLADS